MIAAALVCVTLGVIVWRAEVALRTLAAQRARLQERELALRERELALTEQRQALAGAVDEVPVDVQFRIQAESELWAQEQLRSLVQQLYARHKDWDMVRAEVSAMDAAAIMAGHGWSQSAAVS